MKTWAAGLIVTGELKCDSCNRLMKHPERYGLIKEEGKDVQRLCADCSREKGYLRAKHDDKGHAIESFL